MNLLEQLKKVLALPLHPYIFAFFPSLAMDMEQHQFVLPEDCLLPTLVIEIATVVLFLICWGLLKNAKRAAAITSFTLMWWFSYRAFRLPFSNLFDMLGTSPVPPLLVLLLFFGVLITVVIFLSKDRWQIGKHEENIDHNKLCSMLNVLSVLCVMTTFVPLASFEISDGVIRKKIVAALQQPFENLKLKSNGAKPDIYYIIPDAYPNSRTLQAYWQHDNKPFLDFLKNKGFYVVPQAFSNYSCTTLSMSSSLNMQYIDLVPRIYADNKGENLADAVYWRICQNSNVEKIFKGLGYKFVNVSSATWPTDFMPSADINLFSFPLNEFSTFLIQRTPWFDIESYFPLLRNLNCRARLAAPLCIDQAAKVPGPKFVLIHTTLSHGPFIFDEHGNYSRALPDKTGLEAVSPENYIGQIRFSESELTKMVSLILDKPGPKPVIIIQSDHGAYFRKSNMDEFYNEVMRNLNAYYLPGMDNKGLYETISPVNSFRVVLNDYFDAGLPLLKDRAYCSKDSDREPQKWGDVTDVLKY